MPNAGGVQRSTARDGDFFIDVSNDAFSEESLRVRGNSDSNDNRSAIEDAVLNLASDDTGELTRKRSAMRWDSRKMKYVETNSLNDRPKTKNEAGVIVSTKDAAKETVYQSWVQKTNQRIPKAGTIESESAGRCVAPFVIAMSAPIHFETLRRCQGHGARSQFCGWWQAHGETQGPGWADVRWRGRRVSRPNHAFRPIPCPTMTFATDLGGRSVPNAKVKPELRPTAQIAKERLKKAKVKGRLKSIKSRKARR